MEYFQPFTMAWKRRAPKRKFVKKSRKFYKKARGAKRGFKGRRMLKSNIATSTETFDYGTLDALTAGPTAAARLYTVALTADFPRSKAIAVNYRFYRIRKVTWEYCPEANTYQAAGATAAAIPYMYHVMCRDGNFNGAVATTAGTQGDLLEMGAKPVKFTKPIKISYAPNIVTGCNMMQQDGTFNGGTPGFGPTFPMRKKSPWLSTTVLSTAVSAPPTDDSIIPHFGHQLAITSDSAIIGQVVASIKCTAHFEYKMPLSQAVIT